MIFPSITEYRDALRFEGALKKYSLLELVNDAKGQPCFSSGNFSVVFRMKNKLTSKEYAVKCFTRDQERRQKSYELISKNLNKLHSPYLVHYEYLPDEVWVNSKMAGDGDYPAVIMEWVESKTLGEKLSELCKNEDKTGIFELACAFDRMALWLIEQPFAHGDLKTDNILIEPDGSLRLIDYDGMFTSEMTGEHARENGSPGFRHPKRSANHFGPHIDDFSILLISLSLHSLAENPMISYPQDFGYAILLDETALLTPGEGKYWEILDTLRSNNEVSQRLVMLLMTVGNSAETRMIGVNSILKRTGVKAPEPQLKCRSIEKWEFDHNIIVDENWMFKSNIDEILQDSIEIVEELFEIDLINNGKNHFGETLYKDIHDDLYFTHIKIKQFDFFILAINKEKELNLIGIAQPCSRYANRFKVKAVRLKKDCCELKKGHAFLRAYCVDK